MFLQSFLFTGKVAGFKTNFFKIKKIFVFIVKQGYELFKH